MRFVRALIVTIYTVLSLLGGLGILMLAGGWRLFGLEQKVNAVAFRILAPIYTGWEGFPVYKGVPFVGNPATLLGLALVLLGLLFIWAQIRCSRKAKCIAFENPGGEVDIAVSAVEGFIRRIGSDFPEIKEIDPVIRGGHRGISVVAKVVLWSGGSIPSVAERLQEKIKEDVQSSTGIDVVTVSVIVNRVIPTGSGIDQIIDE